MWGVGKAVEAGPADAFEVKELLLGVPAQKGAMTITVKLYMVSKVSMQCTTRTRYSSSKLLRKHIDLQQDNDRSLTLLVSQLVL